MFLYHPQVGGPSATEALVHFDLAQRMKQCGLANIGSFHDTMVMLSISRGLHLKCFCHMVYGLDWEKLQSVELGSQGAI